MNLPITDTHQHLIYPDKWPYAWTNGIARLAGKAFRLENYHHAATGTGITKTIFMETAPDAPHFHSETKFVCELAERPGSIIAGVVASCRPEDGGFEKYLESIRHARLVGLRRILHVMPDELSRQPQFAKNVRLAGRLGLTFDLCFLARQLPLAIELAEKCPDVQFILDHCGVPDIAAGALDPWRAHVKQIAALPNVACKISGVLAYCKPEQATLQVVQPYIAHCLENFGWDRVVWGGDWPVCNLAASLQQWVAVSRAIVENAAEADQHKFFHQNAARIYNLKPRDEP